MRMSLAQAMAREGHNLLQLARLAGCSWRSARAARDGQLRRPSVARRIADIYVDRHGQWLVDPASMLSFDVGAAGEAGEAA